MGRYAQATVGQTHRLLDRWSNVTAVDVPSEMSELTMRIAAQTMFDIELDDQSGELVEAARHLSDTFIREIHSVFTLPNFLPLPHKRRKRAAIRLFDKLIRDIIHQRRASGEDKGDLLSMLLLAVDQTGDGRGMTDQQVRDEAMTLFTAAFHASSMALTWTWYLLAKHPNVCARLVREVDVVLEQRDATFEDVARLTYTQMVLKESLRLYPPAWALFCREAQAEIELGGYRIPRKSWVFLFPYVTHRDSRFFPDPERFDPERFSPEREKEIPQYAYFPFGAGPRVCIGNMFAMMEMTLVIATLVQKLTLALLPNQPDVQMEPLLSPSSAQRSHDECQQTAREPACGCRRRSCLLKGLRSNIMSPMTTTNARRVARPRGRSSWTRRPAS